MKVALILDHPRRDLGGLCLLSMELVRRGHSVYLVPMYLNDEVLSIIPDLVVLNYLRRPSRNFLRTLHACGIPVAVHSTEGGPINEVQRYKHDLLLEADLTDRIEFYSFWGEKLAATAREESWFPEDRIAVTGSPRFDLYHPDWRAAAIEINRETPAPPQPFVLICSNYGLSNSAFCDGEGAVKALTEQHNYDPALVRSWLASEELAITAMIKLVKSQAERLPSVTFVWRPHPFEKVETYQKEFAGIKNIVVRAEGEIVGWMLRASAAIQQFCTTGFDAWFAGVPSFRPAWIPAYIGVGEQNAVNFDCENEESLYENLKAATSGNYHYDEEFTRGADERTKSWFHGGDGRSYVRLADRIESTIPKHSVAKRVASVRAKTATRFPRRIVDSALHAAGFMPPWNSENFRNRLGLVKRYKASVKYFDPAIVRRITGILAAHSKGSFPAVHVCSGSESGTYILGNRRAESVVVTRG